MNVKKHKRNLFLATAIILLAGACVWFVLQPFSSVPAIRHIVLISLDTTRADHLSCYGYSRPTTPNIDRLAGEGYLFSNAVTPIPLTLPAHASMFTGTIPPQHGKHENTDAYFNPSLVTLATLLKTKGFSTAAFVGSQALNSHLGLGRGFDTYDDQFDQSERRAGEVNREAFAWLEKQKQNPVFLFLHYYDPHDDYDPPEPFATSFKESPYAGEIAYVDHSIGEVVAKLKSLGMYESSLIIVTGDHGEMLGEHGEPTHMYFIYQSAMKVPLVFKLPGSNGPHTIDDLAGIIDIVPTVCDLLGIEHPQSIQGKSLAGYFGHDPTQSEDRFLYYESLYPTKYDANTLLGLIGKRWKYIQTTRPELYDLEEDPAEQTNLAEVEPQRARVFKERLAQLLEETVGQEKSQDSMSLDNRTLQHLQSLGYITGSSVTEDFSFNQSKEDPKDLIDYHNESRKISRLLAENRLSEAREGVEQLAKRRPVFGLYELGTHVAIRQEDYRAAIRFGEKALALEDPSKFFADFHFSLASAYAQTNQIEEAAGHLELILKSAPRAQRSLLSKRVQVHNQLGSLRKKQKKFDLAIAQFKESIRLNPEQPGILHTLAQILLDSPDLTLRDPYKAVKLARQACEQTQSRNPRYLNTLTVAYFTIGNYKEAVRTSEEAVVLARAKDDEELAARLQKQLDLIKRVWAESISKPR